MSAKASAATRDGPDYRGGMASERHSDPGISAEGFPIASAESPRLLVLGSATSTNTELAALARAEQLPPLAAIATLDQRAGRGRLGRTWTAPPGASLAVSVWLAPRADMERWGPITLLGGLAARHAVAAQLPGRDVAVKWPNDVLVAGRKIVGVLAEIVPEAHGVVLGIGINTAMSATDLPVPTATSIAIERGEETAGRDPAALADAVLADLLRELGRLVARFEAAGGDLERAGLLAELHEHCGTIGRDVRVELPDGSLLEGRATGIRADGALELGVEQSRTSTAILAGDVTHLRYQ